MTKCLLKALKAVNLQSHAEIFRVLGYDSAGALANFHPDHYKQLHLNESELIRFHTLLDVLKQAMKAGKICPHYCKSNRPSRSTMRQKMNTHSTHEDAVQYRSSIKTSQNRVSNKTNSNHDLTDKRSRSSTAIFGRSSSASSTQKQHTCSSTTKRPTSMIIHNRTTNHQTKTLPKAVSSRPAVEHVKAKSYNYGVPGTKQQQTTNNRSHYENETNHPRQSSVFINSSRNSGDSVSFSKPAEIYVYARKRPLLSSEVSFQDIISVANNKTLIIAENKANLDSTPLLKKTEFQFDHVFGADSSNKNVFEHTLRSFLSSKQHQNLTYICFGQTGSGKSHTIFGNRNTDGLLIHCTQWLLQEITSHSKLIGIFYEIYNNQVYDLSSSGKRLVVREDSNHHVHVIGGTETVLKNLETLRILIDDGLSRRHHGKSAFNSNSSRSHAVFQISFRDNHQKSDSFKLTFIDLAGSERATDAKNNLRETRREGAQINSSLLALKECIRSMDLTQSHAPFRQSKLTHILRDSLVGTRTRTCLLANVSPADDCCQCSLNTLQYASRIRDISIRHRNRSVPLTMLQQSYPEAQEPGATVSLNKQKPQKTFNPATASTPVHRLVSSVDQRIYMTTKPSDVVASDVKTTKPANIDWRSVENDPPLSGSGDNFQAKSTITSTKNPHLPSQTNSQGPSTSFYLSKLEKQKQVHSNKEEIVTSSYFPPPQADIKKSSDTNKERIQSVPADTIIRSTREPIEIQWKSVPAPPGIHSSRRLSDSSIEPSTSTRMIPLATGPLSDDNQYSSTTATESLGTKITKLATGINPYTQSKLHRPVEKLNLNKNYDTATSTVTSDTEQGLYSDRQSTHRDQTGFFSNRDDPYYDRGYLPQNPLPSIAQETSSMLSPARTPTQSYHQNADGLVTSSFRNLSPSSFSSPLKDQNRHRTKTSLTLSRSSSNSTISEERKSPSPHRRHRADSPHKIIPLRIHSSSPSDESNKYECSFEKHQDGLSSPYSRPLTQFDDNKDRYNDLMHRSLSPTATPKYRLQSPADHEAYVQDSVSPTSPSLLPGTDHRIRLSEHLNTLRSLLESRLREDDDEQVQSRRELSILQTSPGTFTKEFLRSYQQSNDKSRPREMNSDVEESDNDYLESLRRNHTYFDRDNAYIESPTKSPISFNRYGLSTSQYDSARLSYDQNFRNSSKVGLETGSTRSPSTPNPVNVKESRESRILSNGNYTITNDRSMLDSHRPSLTESDLTEVTSNQNSGSTRTEITETLSARTGSNSSAGAALQYNDMERNDSSHRVHDHLLDSGKGSSLFSGTSFDVLMNSLRSMREKDLDFLVERKDDAPIHAKN